MWMNLQKTYELDLARKEAGKATNRHRQRKPKRLAAEHATH